MAPAKFIPLGNYREFPIDEMSQRAFAFCELMQSRRTVRQFSNRPVPREIIEQCVRAAARAPSGANLQPWHFVVVSNQAVKRQIRIAAEQEELEFYNRRAPKEWLDALAPLGTDEHKPFLELAPYLIAVFVERYGLLPDGRRVKHYYAMESVGIATGILITAISSATISPSRTAVSALIDLVIPWRSGNLSVRLLLFFDTNRTLPSCTKQIAR